MLELKCSKCPEEDHEGHFCRCESRNINLAKELRERGMTEWGDKINHPKHYQGNGLEAIDVIEAFGLDFNLGNAIKYILRAGRKDCKKQDLEKASWYIARSIFNEQKESKDG